MKHSFIKLRFDRMQNLQLLSLYSELMVFLKNLDLGSLQLDKSYNRFMEQQPLLKHLDIKFLKSTQTEEIENLRKELDKLISALLLHTKALNRANFADQQQDILIVDGYVQKNLKNIIHAGMLMKLGRINDLLAWLNKDMPFNASFEKLDLMWYAEAFQVLTQQIKQLMKERISSKSKTTKGIGSQTKEHIISELQILLKVIEITAITNPELDYEKLILGINNIMTRHRAFLRNTTTRRKIREEKAEKKLAALQL